MTPRMVSEDKISTGIGTREVKTDDTVPGVDYNDDCIETFIPIKNMRHRFSRYIRF